MKINPLKTGIIGTIILAICCFTPVLVVLFAVLGLSAITGYLDYVLLPTLAFFIILTIYAIVRRNKRCCTTNMDTNHKDNA